MTQIAERSIFHYKSNFETLVRGVKLGTELDKVELDVEIRTTNFSLNIKVIDNKNQTHQNQN